MPIFGNLPQVLQPCLSRISLNLTFIKEKNSQIRSTMFGNHPANHDIQGCDLVSYKKQKQKKTNSTIFNDLPYDESSVTNSLILLQKTFFLKKIYLLFLDPLQNKTNKLKLRYSVIVKL